MWGTDTHDFLVKEAFQGLTSREVYRIQLGSRRVDTYFGSGKWHDIPITLIISEAPKHAMRPEGMTKAAAEQKALEWINAKVNDAIRQQRTFKEQGGKGLSETALFSFGCGAHTLMDWTSPAHADFQEYKVPKKVIFIPSLSGLLYPMVVMDLKKYVKEGLEHKENETHDKLTLNQKNRAIKSMQVLFRETFGITYYKVLTNKLAG